MRFPSSLKPLQVLALVFAFSPQPAFADGSSYFIVTEPQPSTQWTNGAPNSMRWTKGLLDGVAAVDIELARMSTDGLLFIASQVPAQLGTLNVVLQNVPPADDYYLIFLNSTHGVMYALSQRFTILPAGGAASNDSAPSPSVPTITVAGPPNPTSAWATVFPVLASGAHSLISTHGTGAGAWGVSAICVFATLWTLL